MPLRGELLDSFEPAMLPVGCLDRYELMGAVAGWWEDIHYELRVIVENGFAIWSMVGWRVCARRWRMTAPKRTRRATRRRL